MFVYFFPISLFQTESNRDIGSQAWVHIVQATHPHTHTYPRTRAHTYTHRHTHACTHTYTRTHTQTHTQESMYTHTHAHIHAHIHTHLHAHIHTHMHARTHKHTHRKPKTKNSAIRFIHYIIIISILGRDLRKRRICHDMIIIIIIIIESNWWAHLMIYPNLSQSIQSAAFCLHLSDIYQCYFRMKL